MKTTPLPRFQRRVTATTALSFLLPSLCISTATANPVPGDLTVEGDIIVVDGTNEFKIRNGTDGVDFWHNASREWMWSYGDGVTPTEVMRLGPDNVLRLFDRNVTTGDAVIVIDPGNSGTTAPSIMIGGDEVLTVANSPSLLANHFVIRYSSGRSSHEAFLMRGDFGGNGAIPTSGAGTRMMWYPEKAAFRVGRVTGTHWDNNNIGNYSIAMGYNAKATGSDSVSMGYATYASEAHSVAIGIFAEAHGWGSAAIGSWATTSQNAHEAIALGGHAMANYAIAGTGSNAYGSHSVAFAAASAQGDSSIAIGGLDWNHMNWPGNQSNEDNSTAIGGVGNKANGFSSLASGFWTNAASGYSTALGSLNLGLGTGGDTWYETDPLFELGNGIAPRSWEEPDASIRSNAITTLKNGQTSLINKAWKTETDANPNDPEAPLADYGTSSSGGNALVVDGHTVLNGKVVISVPQGDISMGNYQ